MAFVMWRISCHEESSYMDARNTRCRRSVLKRVLWNQREDECRRVYFPGCYESKRQPAGIVRATFEKEDHLVSMKISNFQTRDLCLTTGSWFSMPSWVCLAMEASWNVNMVMLPLRFAPMASPR
jgi:hypothetical protein